MGEYKYYAFISYSHADKKNAKWLQRKIENYRLPSRIKKEKTDLPKRIRPIFRDETDLDVGFLDQSIKEALDSSRFLIVICSENAAKSQWVNSEIDYFVKKHPKGNILPFIVNTGEHNKSTIEGTYPQALLKLNLERELLGVDVGALGKDASAVKIISRLLNVRFDVIWERYRREQAKKSLFFTLSVLLIGIFGVVSALVYRHQRDMIAIQEMLLEEDQEKLLINQSRFVAKEAEELVAANNSFLARKLLIEVMPKNIGHPNRPYVPEAGIALRKAFKNNSFIYYAENDVNRAILSNDRSIIATGDANGTINIINVSDGRVLMSKSSPNGFIYDLDLDESGNLIAYVSEEGLIGIWDWRKNTEITWSSTNSISKIRFLFSDDQVVTSGEDGILSLWSIPKREITKMTNCGHSITSIACIKGKIKQIITGDSDGNISLWDAESLTMTKTMHAHKGSVNDCKVTKSGRYVISCSNDSTCMICDINRIKPDNKFKIGDICSSIDMSSDDIILSVGSYSGKISLYEWKKKKDIKQIDCHTDYVSSLQFSSDGEFLISSSWDNSVSVIDLYEREPNCEMIDVNSDSIVTASLCPAGNKIVIALKGGKVLLVDLQSKKQRTVCLLPKELKIIRPAGENKIIGATDSSLVSINLKNGDVIWCTKMIGGITDIDINYTNSLIVTSASDKTVILFDFKNLAEIRHFRGHTDAVKSVKFNSSGTQIITTSEDMTFRTWDVASGERILKRKFNDALSGGVFICSDSTIIAGTVGGLIYKYDLNGKFIESISAHDKLLSSLSTNGDILVTTSYTEPVKIWKNGIEIETLRNTSWISQLSISEKSDRLLTVSVFGTIKLWNFLSTSEMINRTYKQFSLSPLTPKEKTQYYIVH